MSPTPPKKEEDVAVVLEQWLTEVRLIEMHGDTWKLPEPFKFTALRIIMSLKEDQFDQMV